MRARVDRRGKGWGKVGEDRTGKGRERDKGRRGVGERSGKEWVIPS